MGLLGLLLKEDIFKESYKNMDKSLVMYYLVAINLLAILITIYDKFASKYRRKKRTRESTLLWIATLGGSVGMLLTMIIIGHKTRHRKFMLGIPLLIVLQMLLLYLYETL